MIDLTGLQGPGVTIIKQDKPMLDAPSFVKTQGDLQELQAFLVKIVALARQQWEAELAAKSMPT